MANDSVPLAVPPPPPRNVRHILRVAGWNLLLILAGLLLICAAGETYFRLTVPFTDSYQRVWRFVPGVGQLYKPNAELRFTNNVDFWTVQRTNSLGFLDREPIASDRIAGSCYITFIGDSFVNASEVPLADKFHILLEEIATGENPDLGIITSAFGISDTGQVNQLPLYDGYARHLGPDMVVLVFNENDLLDNSTFASGLIKAFDPYHMPRVHAARNLDGSFKLGRPDPDFVDFLLWGLGENPPRSQPARIAQTAGRLKNLITRNSYFARWMEYKIDNLRRSQVISSDDSASENSRLIARAEHLISLPEYAFMSGYQIPGTVTRMKAMLKSGLASDVSREAWESTEFGLEQFKHRADHDGTALMILAVYDSGGKGDPLFDRLSKAAGSLSIPVISQHDYIVRQGGRVEDARFIQDFHWNATGHRWAAEAVWEHIKREWNGECPSVEPDSGVDIDWVKVGHYIHTPEGEVWVEIYPKDTDAYSTTYMSVTADSPVARSDWNVYLYSNGVTYAKDPCVPNDKEALFFLHVFPADERDLPEYSQSNDFHSITFHSASRGAMFDGKCIVSIDLPQYEIASISTGQFIKDVDSQHVQIWSAYYNFNLPEVMDAVQELLQSGREADIKASFDVYIDDGQLVYVNESCNADDRDLPFFLHMFPADENDLAEGREEPGFDNLGFKLMQRGGEHHGLCFAAVDLPAYDIASIRTGQWLRDEGNVWEASIEFGE